MLAKSYVGMVTLSGAAALVVAVLIMQATTPLLIGPLGVTAWFVLVLGGLSAICAAVAYVAASLLSKRYGKNRPNRRRRVVDSARRGLLVGSYATILLGLSSLQQLNLRDAVLLVVLFGLIEFYTVARHAR